jgi:hypothetical protein
VETGSFALHIFIDGRFVQFYIYTYIHTYVYTCICIYIHTRYISIYICIYIHMYIYTHTHTHAHTHTHQGTLGDAELSWSSSANEKLLTWPSVKCTATVPRSLMVTPCTLHLRSVSSNRRCFVDGCTNDGSCVCAHARVCACVYFLCANTPLPQALCTEYACAPTNKTNKYIECVRVCMRL